MEYVMEQESGKATGQVWEMLSVPVWQYTRCPQHRQHSAAHTRLGTRSGSCEHTHPSCSECLCCRQGSHKCRASYRTCDCHECTDAQAWAQVLALVWALVSALA